MAFRTRYVLIASMDVRPDKEALFHEVYDREHVPLLREVPGVVGIQRLVKQPLRISLGGEVVPVDSSGEPRYSAIYEIESPDVLLGDAWGSAVEQGRWPREVRPFTLNRRHVLAKVLEPAVRRGIR